MCMSDFDSVDEWREQLLEKYRELSGEEITSPKASTTNTQTARKSRKRTTGRQFDPL